jgi:hypothetical protein
MQRSFMGPYWHLKSGKKAGKLSEVQNHPNTCVGNDI